MAELGRAGLILRAVFGLLFAGLCANGLATFFGFEAAEIAPLAALPGTAGAAVGAVSGDAAPTPAPVLKSITADILICESGAKGLFRLGLRFGRVAVTAAAGSPSDEVTERFLTSGDSAFEGFAAFEEDSSTEALAGSLLPRRDA